MNSVYILHLLLNYTSPFGFGLGRCYSSFGNNKKFLSILCQRIFFYSSKFKTHSWHPQLFRRTGSYSKCLLPFPLTIGVLRAKCESCDSSESSTATDACKFFLSEELLCARSQAPIPTPDPSCEDENESTNCASSSQIRWEPTELSHEYLMKQACIVTVDSVTRILTETVSTIEDYHCQYREFINLLMDLLNETRQACESNQELITCKMIVVRSRMEELRKQIVEIECYLNSVERLAHVAAEVAFLGRAEYCSVALSERLESTLQEAKRIKLKTTELERDMNELQAVVIVESGQSLK